MGFMAFRMDFEITLVMVRRIIKEALPHIQIGEIVMRLAFGGHDFETFLQP